MKINYFEVKGLFGETDIAIPITDNKLVLIGYNGIGKSTVLNLFYYLLSQQWRKIVDQDFYSICIQIEQMDEIEVLRSDIQAYIESQTDRRRMGRHLRYSRKDFDNVIRYIDKNFSQEMEFHDDDQSIETGARYKVIRSISSEFAMPLSAADEIYRNYVFRSKVNSPIFDKSTLVVQELEEAIDNNLNGRILYLPTYRRIERDVKDVFPEFEDEIRKKLQTRRGRTNTRTHIELVEFGMDDVEDKIKDRLENIRGYALSQVNSLTGRYLRDVIRNKASELSIGLPEVDQLTLDAVLQKIDDQTLTENDKNSLYGVVEKINAGVQLEGNEKYIAHYVTYLAEVGRNIYTLERSILHFANVCNSYLFGKQFVLDNKEYKLVIQRESGREVGLDQLSSGEKQIVSLFSHLLLDDMNNNYIIIDEPELSLSVDWQQRFLQDIANTQSCELIFAVTHSPFIYDNELDQHAVDLLECEVGHR